MTARPRVTRHSLVPGDIVLFTSDSLPDLAQLEVLSDEEKGDLFVCLADATIGGGTTAREWEARIGHGFLGEE